MQFKHAKGVRLALDSGHVTHVGTEWQPLDERFHQEAFAKGCQCDQTVIGERAPHGPTTGANAMKPHDEKQAIADAIKLMLSREEEDDFTSAGNPNANVVSKLCGLKVGKDDMLGVWHALKDEIAREEAERKAAEEAAAAASNPQ